MPASIAIYPARLEKASEAVVAHAHHACALANSPGEHCMTWPGWAMPRLLDEFIGGAAHIAGGSLLMLVLVFVRWGVHSKSMLMKNTNR